MSKKSSNQALIRFFELPLWRVRHLGSNIIRTTNSCASKVLTLWRYSRCACSLLYLRREVVSVDVLRFSEAQNFNPDEWCSKVCFDFIVTYTRPPYRPERDVFFCKLYFPSFVVTQEARGRLVNALNVMLIQFVDQLITNHGNSYSSRQCWSGTFKCRYYNNAYWTDKYSPSIPNYCRNSCTINTYSSRIILSYF